MTLHRNIYWLGRQWAVTGFGIQLVDQRRKMAFDIEAHRLGEEGLADAMAGQPWFDAEDFAMALDAARKRSRDMPTAFFRPTFEGEK